MIKKSVKKSDKKAPAEVSASGDNSVRPFSRFTDFDIHLFRSGKHYKLYEKLGSHVMQVEGRTGTYFAVWAPNAKYLSVIGNFNGWSRESHPLFLRWDSSGIWEGFIPNIGNGEVYKFFIRSNSGEELEKSDPYALRWEEPPRTASIVWDTWYEWKDNDWMQNRYKHNSLNSPYSVYEVHFGSWMRSPDDPAKYLGYRIMADNLVPYVKEMGFTHVEFMPLMEHPFYPSWGYQITGYFAASSLYGTPQDLMYLIEKLHENGIGVIFDWVPSHFPGDVHGLFRFDGTHLYEHSNEKEGFHPDWKSYIFNYGRNEVRSFLISNAIFWLERFHVDGLRVDAVASMLYRDYSRKEGEWIPNQFGGRENLEAISFLKEFNIAVYSHFPDVQTIAEESTAFPGVSKPVFSDGLGFGMKWMMGWMHDTLKYFKEDPINRKYYHGQITFSTVYAFTENFMLPLSHDEVVHGKHAMINKMPGDEWQKFANLRVLYTYMFTHPGAKLLFMGSEFGQKAEWNVEKSLDWHLLDLAPHKGMKELVKGLNQLYRGEPGLYEKNFEWDGFHWIEAGDAENSVLVYCRKGNDLADSKLVIILNLTPIPRYDYRVGLPHHGDWEVVFNSDEKQYYGSGFEIAKHISTENVHWHGSSQSATLNLPPLSGVVLKRFNRTAKFW
ncbi:1,4-alpha-glucan branching protein GlgB [Pedobacter sp. SYSU D00535]|uniref:1,4-alpha-glucan branching protein GlgB n=1 Tax=Pedobacter sp. SYSU D00535 TaxID=2810308 RepID=UPI001A977556|nr:1,4-alpha-glucan branching protein GlgB [Pedobacter sp. SYSU D00535]